jgi:hypothetical protein
MAWEHGGPDFQARFDKSTGQAPGNERRGAASIVMAIMQMRKYGTALFTEPVQ